jgi:hypothetical protein
VAAVRGHDVPVITDPSAQAPDLVLAERGARHAATSYDVDAAP